MNSIILILCFLTYKVNPSHSQPLALQIKIDDSISGVWNSTRVVVSPNGTSGTGVIVHKDGWLVTAKHVSDSISSATGAQPTLVFGPNGEQSLVKYISFFTEPAGIDMSLLKLEPIQGNFSPANISQMPTDTVHIGREIGVIGSLLELDKKTNKIAPMPIVKRGVICSIDPFQVSFWIDAHIVPGDSGGPVFDLKTGEILGIVVEINTLLLERDYIKHLPPVSQAIPLEEIIKIFKSIPSEMIQPDSPSSYKITIRSYLPVYARVIPTIYIKELLRTNGLIKFN